MFKLIWLLGWLRPRTAARRLALIAVLSGTVGAGALSVTSIVGSSPTPPGAPPKTSSAR